jgi:AraC-like DNA-binding protein
MLEDQLDEELVVQSPPNGFNAMVFTCGHSYKAFQGPEDAQEVPKAFLSGQFTSNYHLVLKGNVRIAGIVFRATALHNLFGLRMSNLVNNRMPLHYILEQQADLLYEAVKLAEDTNARADVLFNFLLRRIEESPLKLNAADEAVLIIDRQKGNITVKEVAEELHVSQRTLEKWFLEKVGISPKLYCRIKRFAVLSNIVAHKEKVDWQEILFEAGFHDQSHLIKEYLDFNKMNPAEYHQKHHEASRFVKKD